MRDDAVLLRLCLALVRAIATLVPLASRDDWRAEWEAEIRHRWIHMHRDRRRWRSRLDLVRRVLGAVPDAAWLRRQFTADADVVRDLRHGIRTLRHAPTFTLSAVCTLALGIGGTVALAAILDTLYFRALPYADADRIVTLWQQHGAQPNEREDVAPANFLDWRERSRSFAWLAAAIPYSHDYTGAGEPEVFFGAQVTEGFWQALGVQPLLGRLFSHDEYVDQGRRVVILSYGLWQRRFGGRPAVLDSTISLDGEPWTVVGVLPRDFSPQLLPRPGELGIWTPKHIQPHESGVRGSHWWNVVGRLAPGVTLAQARRELDTISAGLAREYPSTNAGLYAAVVPLRDHLMMDVRRPLLLMFGAVVLVLAIGCANVASLLLARGVERGREFAIRSALGAGRLRLVRQLIAESLLLAALGGAGGLLVARWTLQTVVALAPAGALRLRDAAIDGRALVFALAVTGVTALAFGLLPALAFSRGSGALAERQPGTAMRSGLRRLLVAAEVALSLVLLASAGLLVRSFDRLLAVDPGFSPRNVVALQVFAWDRNGRPDRARTFFSTTLERLRALPGVQAAGAVSAMPFISANIDIKSPFEIVGRVSLRSDERADVYLTIATPGYFEAMSIPLREGRLLDSRDHERAAPVALVSDALRRREWPNESPLGRRIKLQWQGDPIEVEVVGVVGQLRHDGLDRRPRPEVFVPLDQHPFASMTYVVRGRGEPDTLIEAARREIWTIDPLQTFYDAATLERLVTASVVRQRFIATLMSALALVALVMCAVGLYGVISFTTARRTREIGVRMALGADGGSIRRMVLRDGALLIGAGIAAGAAGAAATGRLLESLLFEIRPADPLTLSAVSALLAVVGLAACYAPARRATRVDPIVALRPE